MTDIYDEFFRAGYNAQTYGARVPPADLCSEQREAWEDGWCASRKALHKARAASMPRMTVRQRIAATFGAIVLTLLLAVIQLRGMVRDLINARKDT